MIVGCGWCGGLIIMVVEVVLVLYSVGLRVLCAIMQVPREWVLRMPGVLLKLCPNILK
jgi:hypothetical protein